jgi:hypothetical protein
MPDHIDTNRANMVGPEAFAYITRDITGEPRSADLERLRALGETAVEALPRAHLPAIEVRTSDGEALVVVRRDERSRVLTGLVADSLTGLKPDELLGPFLTDGGTAVRFDVFLAAQRTEVRQSGVVAPALVFTDGAPPVVGQGTAVDIEGGTVWIRGDLIDAGLPADAFVGIKVVGGSLSLTQMATVTTTGVLTTIEITTPIRGLLELQPAPDDVTPVAGACSASGAAATMPDSLSFRFGAGTSTVEATTGKGELWGQEFRFGASATGWRFAESLWTVVLAYDFEPKQFNADPIGDDLVHFSGIGGVDWAGLGLPVVLAPDPSILGEASVPAQWFLSVTGLAAGWYDTDPRLHELPATWIGISGSGVTILAEGVAPLSPSVSHFYDLWTIIGSAQRLPWRQTYDQPFSLLYRCDVVHGEFAMVQGRADVAFDRPVTTDGMPVPIPTTRGTLLLHSFDGTVTAMLGAAVEDEHRIHQFALRNALTWTGEPTSVVVRGDLLERQRIDAGEAQLPLGALGWAPTLPDPYVSNVFIRRPERFGEPQAVLVARISWTAPDAVLVSFEGQVGTGLALGGRDASAGGPRPARRSDGDPDVGLTQVEQGRLFLDRTEEADRKKAQAAEQQGRAERLKLAQGQDRKSVALVDGYLAEVVGPTPNVLLLDVSTNQDLLGIAVGAVQKDDRAGPNVALGVSELAVKSELTNMRVVALPQVQWEPVRTLDADQDIMTMGWFPTPLASAGDGGATQIGARSQKLMPIIPQDALKGTIDVYAEGVPVGIRTTFPFGLVGAVRLHPRDTPQRKADLYQLTRPSFPDEQSVGGIQVTAHAEGGRSDDGGVSPMFDGRMRQLLNGVDLASGVALGLSVLGETLQPAGSVETVFNDDMAANPRVPVTRIDLSGYGASNFTDWNNPFAAFAEAAKVQFRLIVGRTALEVIKVNSVLHPWGVRVTRSVTIERRPGGGVIRRDSGWQAFTPGLFDYRYSDGAGGIDIAPYLFDAGVFQGLFNVRNIRPAPGAIFPRGPDTLVPYYFDADAALEGVPGRTAAVGVLGYLQTTPNGVPASPGTLQALIEAQGPIGGPVDAWMDFGGSGLRFRAQRVEVGLAMDGADPLFVATVRGAPKLPDTGAWSVAVRPVTGVPANGGEAVPVGQNRGVPVIRRYPVMYPNDQTVFTEPPLAGTPGDYRFADAADLLTPTAPANDYLLLQSTATHAFAYPRVYVTAANPRQLQSGQQPALADILARSTSKGAFPPPRNTIALASGSLHFDVTAAGKLALSSPVSIAGYPTPLRLGGTPGHGTNLVYDTATLQLRLDEDRWEADFSGLQIWSDISGLNRLTGAELHIVGGSDQRPQIAEMRSLILQEIEEILQYIPLFGNRGVQGPIDLTASNAKHELKVEAQVAITIPPTQAVFPAGAGVKLKLSVKQSTGIDLATGGPKASATFGAELDGKVPLLSGGVVAVFLIVTGEVTFSLTSVSGSVTAEKLELMAFVGIGVEGKIGPFKAYAFLGIGFDLVYDAIASQTKYGGLVALEAGVDLQIVQVKIRAELKGLVYRNAGKTKCDYSGSVKLEVDIFLIFSISVTYQVTETAVLS